MFLVAWLRQGSGPAGGPLVELTKEQRKAVRRSAGTGEPVDEPALAQAAVIYVEDAMDALDRRKTFIRVTSIAASVLLLGAVGANAFDRRWPSVLLCAAVVILVGPVDVWARIQTKTKYQRSIEANRQLLAGA